MKTLTTMIALAATMLFTSPAAKADTWVQGTITEIRVVSDGVSNYILVTGNFTPATGCTNNGFMLLSGDAYFAQSYALLLAAQVSGSTVKYLHSYCNGPNGRGNSYALVR